MIDLKDLVDESERSHAVTKRQLDDEREKRELGVGLCWIGGQVLLSGNLGYVSGAKRRARLASCASCATAALLSSWPRG